jgi:hypothetical protein
VGSRCGLLHGIYVSAGRADTTTDVRPGFRLVRSRVTIQAGICVAAFGTLAVQTAAGQAERRQSGGSERRLVLPDGRTAGLSGSYWEAAIADGGPAPRHERLLVVMPDGRVRDVVDGERDHVLLPLELARELSERSLGVTLVHNHLSGVSLSGADLLHLSKLGVASVVALGSDGSVYEASGGSRIDRFSGELYLLLVDRIRQRLTAEAWRDAIDPAVLEPHAAHLIALVLHRTQLIDYRTRPSMADRLTWLRFRDLFDRVIATETHRLQQDLRAATR